MLSIAFNKQAVPKLKVTTNEVISNAKRRTGADAINISGLLNLKKLGNFKN